MGKWSCRSGGAERIVRLAWLRDAAAAAAVSARMDCCVAGRVEQDVAKSPVKTVPLLVPLHESRWWRKMRVSE